MKGTEMKGIERLLDWVGTLRLSGLVWAEEMADELESTIGLIKREHAEDCCKMGLDYGAVSRVVTDMERHVSGVEGADDSPVALWARELRSALVARPLDSADDASVSAYDLLPADEREAIAWVREHGGLSHVKDIYHDFRAVVERLGIEWSESELHGLMDALDSRLMPEGLEWLRYDTGEPVRIGGAIADELGHGHVVTSVEVFEDAAALHWNPDEPEERVWAGHGERVRRPESKCRDCAHWQKDPTADKMGVCWFFYHEHEGQDCYPARLGDIGACEEFMPRGKELADDAFVEPTPDGFCAWGREREG